MSAETLEEFLREAKCPYCGANVGRDPAGQASLAGRFMIGCYEHGWLELRAWGTEDGRQYALFPPREDPGKRDN